MDQTKLFNEKDLLMQVSEGDAIAFRQLFDHYRNKIYSLGMYLTRSETLSEEIVQDVFLKVWEKRDQLTEINYFNAWLRTVAKNTCSNYFRSFAMEKIAMSRYAVGSDTETASAENDIIAKEFGQIIDEAIRKLPPQRQRVYRLSQHSGKKQDEVARELNISVYTVKEHMKLARRSIRGYLESRLDLILLAAIAYCLR